MLTYVEQGNGDAGLVYVTDAATTSGVSAVAQASAESRRRSATPVLLPPPVAAMPDLVLAVVCAYTQ